MSVIVDPGQPLTQVTPILPALNTPVSRRSITRIDIQLQSRFLTVVSTGCGCECEHTAKIAKRNTELADAAPAALDTRRARTVRAPLFSHSKVRRKSAIALMRSVFLQPAGLAAPATGADARMPWMVPSGASKAPAASRATSEQLARPARLLLATLRPLWPPGWTVLGRSLGTQRVGAVCCTLATSELGIMVCRRVWRPSASLHRHRARTRLWCKQQRRLYG